MKIMNKQQFKESCKELDSIVTDKLFGTKHKEYSIPSDMFKNFNTASELMNIPPERVAFGYMAKHYVSIRDMLDTMFQDIDDVLTSDIFSLEYKQEKITDMIGYLKIIYGLIK